MDSEEKNKKLFFDAHMHAFNLSHVGILAFVNRFLLNFELDYNDLIENRWFKVLKIVMKKIVKKLFSFGFRKEKKAEKSGLQRIVNVLSIFENNLSRQFQYIELDFIAFSNNNGAKSAIKNLKTDVRAELETKDETDLKKRVKVNLGQFNNKLASTWRENEKNYFEIGSNKYSQIVLTPLMMDFYYKGFHGLNPDKVHYFLPPRKPISEQALDLFTGIYQYYRYTPFNALLIYPFIAINPENFDYQTQKDKVYSTSLLTLLDKYFEDFDKYNAEKRLQLLENKRNTLLATGPLDSNQHYYAGIKMYPPLGFDPWPEDDSEKLEHVKLFYKYCEEKQIPITTHASDGGFVLKKEDENKLEASPFRWAKAIKHFPKLRLNFAHAATRKKNPIDNDWSRKMLELVNIYDNIYFDISDNADKKDYYKQLFRFVVREAKKKNYNLTKLTDRIIYGTDFMVNLFHIDSYQDYIKALNESDIFSGPFTKDKICSVNPYRFLFG